MTIDKKNLYSFCFFLFLVLILIFTASKNFSSKIGNSFYSSLIYEKSDPCFFELSFADQNVLSFYKENNQWFVLSKKTFPADNNLVDGLINTLKEKILFTPISNKQDIWSEYGLTNDSAFKISLFDVNKVLINELYFGYEQISKNKIAFRSSLDISSFAIENNISSYLEADIKRWTMLDIFPNNINQNNLQELEFKVYNNDKSDVSKIKKKNGNWILKINNSSSFYLTDYSKVSSLITSLASSRALDPNLDNYELSDKNIIYSLILIFGDGKIEKINIYSISKNDDFYVLKKQDSYFSYIVSNFTIQKILNIFDSKNIVE